MPGASSSLPSDRTVRLMWRADPQDSNSWIDWNADLELTAERMSTTSVTWRIKKVRVRDLDEQGNVLRSWLDNVDASGNPLPRWTTTHADPNSPVAAEFWNVPSINRTAAPDGSYGSLAYEWTGAASSPPGNATAFFHFYQFKVGGNVDHEGEDEWVIIDLLVP